MSVIKIYLNLKDGLYILKEIDEKYKDLYNKYIIDKKLKQEVENKKNIIVNDNDNNMQWIASGYSRNKIIDYNNNNYCKWPKKSNILCWYCTRFINKIPIGIPYKKVKSNFSYYKENELKQTFFKELETNSNSKIINTLSVNRFNNNIYYTIGAFCSFSCAYTWNNINELKMNKNKLETYLYELYNYFGFIGKIKKAIPKEFLSKYGGILTQMEYSLLSDNNKIHLGISMPPLVSLQPSYKISLIKKNNSNIYKYV